MDPMNTIEINGVKIVTYYWPAPVPIRIWDWQACIEDGDELSPFGEGKTEQEAIAALLRRIGEE
jgi:hypothetical protein